MWIQKSPIQIKEGEIVKYQKNKKVKPQYYVFEEGKIQPLIRVEEEEEKDGNEIEIENQLFKKAKSEAIYLRGQTKGRMYYCYKSDEEIKREKEERETAENRLEKYVEIIKTKLENKIEIKKDEYVQEISEWVANIILFGEKLDIDHSNDEYWDSSGEICYTGEKFNPEDYKRLKTLLSEYNGEKEPSFMSGCGFFHNTYEKDLEEMTNEFVWDMYNEIVEDFYKDDNNQDFRDCCHVVIKDYEDDVIENDNEMIIESTRYLSEVDVLDEYINFDARYHLMDTVSNMSVVGLYNIGKFAALKNADPNYIKVEELYYELIKKIKSLNGLKVISIVLENNFQTFELENDKLSSPITVNGRSHFEQLKILIKKGISDGGAITIRQFTPLKIEIETSEEKRFVPIKNIYGVELGNYSWRGVSSKEMEIAHCTDMNTGEVIPKEKAVIYSSFN